MKEFKMDVSFLTAWFTLNIVFCLSGDPMTMVSGNDLKTHTKDGGDDKIRSLETGLSDVKSIIMEKYGRHYRLTGGSMLATKRNKPVTVDSASPNSSNATAAPVQNVTLTPSNSNLTESESNISNSNATVKNETNPTKSETLNVTAVTKSDIVNATDVKTNNTREEIVHLDGTQLNNNTVQFGSPPEKPKPKADSENNITAEGNLTTINIDLTKSGDVNAVIPGIDLSQSPISQVDIVYGNETNNSPKRSGTNHAKPKKNIVFQITKPRMTINDFANKRKIVPHASKKSSKHQKKSKLSKRKKGKNKKRSRVANKHKSH